MQIPDERGICYVDGCKFLMSEGSAAKDCSPRAHSRQVET